MKLKYQLFISLFLLYVLLIGFDYLFLFKTNKITDTISKDIPKNLQILELSSHLDKLSDLIRYYDEVLTQSARNYALTQDKKWERRYKEAEPKLDTIIKEAIEKGDEKDREFFRSTDEANIALVKLEYQAIDYVNNNKTSEAIKILDGDEYSKNKKIYSQGIEDYAKRRASEKDFAFSSTTRVISQIVEYTSNFSSQSKNLNLYFVIIVSILGLVLGYIITHSIIGPLDKLHNSIKEIGKGNLQSALEIDRDDEIGEISRSFHALLQDIEGKNEEIKKHQTDLEGQIAERTKQLDEKLKELQVTKKATLNIMEDTDEANRQLIETQEKLQQNLQELKKLDYQKDQFISIAAHELKTPLTSIKGFTELLSKENISINKESRNKYLRIIAKDTKRLGELISNILELSRMDLGTLKLAWQEVNIKELVTEVKEQMDIIIHAKKLESDFIIEQNLPDISIDKDKIIQVISNLINNAVHYTETGKISIRVARQGEFVLFSVSDQGIGIPKENWPKIFTRFYQVDNPLTRKIGGTGLGLSISKGFVEAMGGKIWFDSEDGKGTTFHFTIPISRNIHQGEVQIMKETSKLNVM